MLWKATATAEKEMQNMKHVWKRYLIVTAMTVVLGLSAGCGSAAEDTNNNQNNTQDEIRRMAVKIKQHRRFPGTCG